MLSMALELAQTDPVYEDMASKFFEHFVRIADAMNSFGGTGLWDEDDGFYYDRLHADGHEVAVPLRSFVGLLPMVASSVLEQSAINRLPDFKKRLRWFLENRRDLAERVSFTSQGGKMLLAIPSRDRLVRLLRRMLDEREFLSPYGVRSLSKVHGEQPLRFEFGGQTLQVAYEPGESRQWMFGGNSNWRGPIWLPANYLLIEALERYHHFFGDDLRVECPVGSGRQLTLLRGRVRAVGPVRAAVPAGRERAPSLPRRRGCVRERPALARPGAVLRILRRRHGARPGREPPDGMDGAGGAVSRVAGAPAAPVTAQPD